MDIDKIRKRAQEIWEAEGKPEGQHERHWRQAEHELTGSEEVRETVSPADQGAKPEGRNNRKSGPVASQQDGEPRDPSKNAL